MLNEIINNKLKEVNLLKETLDVSSIDMDPNLKNDFYKKLLDNQNNKKNSIIAEIKRKSPSKGVLDDNLSVAKTVAKYATGGAACVSVLTERDYFNGSNEDLLEAKNTIELPLLRKDFMLDPIQIYESKILGADCVLLIVSALSKSMYKEMFDLASELNLDVLTEVHDQSELDFALSQESKLIGINNRNLKTFDVDINTSINLSSSINETDIVLVSESGIQNRNDIIELNSVGIYTFLVGEHLVKSKDIINELGVLINGK
jgi:indole-3-glycerol phosphate synthase